MRGTRRRRSRRAAEPLRPLATNRVYMDRRFHDAAVFDRNDLRPGDAIPGPAVIREDNATTVVEPGWRATFTDRGDLLLERVRGRRSRARDRHDGGSGAARSVQQPLHGDRRADGRDARQHRLFGQYQGTPRLLVRAVRRRGQPDRQRAAHARAPGVDGRKRAHDHRPARRDDAGGRCVRAQCALQRRHAPAGRDGDRAGVPERRLVQRRCGNDTGSPRSRGRQSTGVLRRLPRTPRRHRRHHARLDAARLEACRRGGRAARQRRAGRRRVAFSKPRCARSSKAAAIPRAMSSRIWPTSARRSPRARRARRSSRRWSRTSAPRSSAPT